MNDMDWTTPAKGQTPNSMGWPPVDDQDGTDYWRDCRIEAQIVILLEHGLISDKGAKWMRDRLAAGEGRFLSELTEAGKRAMMLV